MMMMMWGHTLVDYHVMNVAVCTVCIYVCLYVYLRALKSRKRTLVSDWIVDTDDAMSRVDCMLLSKLLKVLLLMINDFSDNG